MPYPKLGLSPGLPSPPSPDTHHLCQATQGLVAAYQDSFPSGWSSNEIHKVGNSMPGRGKSSARPQQQETGKGVSLVWGLQAWGSGAATLSISTDKWDQLAAPEFQAQALYLFPQHPFPELLTAGRKLL